MDKIIDKNKKIDIGLTKEEVERELKKIRWIMIHLYQLKV